LKIGFLLRQATFEAAGKKNKMIVISDGDLIKNQLDKTINL
jgi:nicotinic acid phosphoribosyltransferase